MEQLSERQKQILSAIINDHIETAEAVGSETLIEDHDFDFSPATARNEMAELTRKGYLQKDHTSAGRAPTTLAFRYYIKNLMQEKELPVVNEVAIKQRLWAHRHDLDQLLHQASLALAEELQNLTLIITNEGKIYTAGAAHILRHPEFYDIDLTRTILYLLDQHEVVSTMLNQLTPEAEFGILLGEEIGMPSLRTCGMVVGRIDLPSSQTGYISVFGPYRLDYSMVIPTLKYLQQLVNELCQAW